MSNINEFVLNIGEDCFNYIGIYLSIMKLGATTPFSCMMLVGRTGRPPAVRQHRGGSGRGEEYLWVDLSEEEVVRSLKLLSQVHRGDYIIFLRYRDGWRIETIGKIRLILRSPRFSNVVGGISFEAFKKLGWIGEDILDESTRHLIGSVIKELSGSVLWRSIDRGGGVTIVGEILILCDKKAPQYLVDALSRGVRYGWGILSMY